MASKIRGIEIEISANTSKMLSGLKDVDKELKTTQTALRDVNKLLKFNPGNADLLAQKQKFLSSAIETTEKRLEELKKAQEGVAKDTPEWDALQREIIDTETDLRRLKDQYREFGSIASQQIKAVGEKMETIGTKMAEVGAGLTKKISVPIVAGFTAAVKTTADFDKAMAQVAATMGKTVDEVGDLREFAKQMGESTAFSATEAAEALNYMALAGYDAEASMEMLPTVLALAAASGMDLATASDMVTDAQSAFGLSMEETAAMTDQMAKASSKSNTSVSQLGEAMLKIGATARSVKGGTVELTTLLGVLADNGIKGAEGGTHLRNVLLSLQSAAQDGAVKFGDFAVSIYDAEGNMRSMPDILGDIQAGMGDMSQEAKDALLSGIFNKTDLAAVNALLGTSAERFDELGTAINDSSGAAQQMADTQLDNLSGQLTLLKSAAEGLAISVGELLMPVVRSMVERLQKLVTWINKLNPAQKQIVVRVAAVAAAIGPLLTGVGKLTKSVGVVLKTAPKIATAIKGVSAGIKVLGKGIGTAVKVVPKITGAIKAVGALLSPTTLVIAAVAAAVVAAAILIIKNWDWVKDKAKAVRDFVVKAWTAIRKGVSDAAKATADFVTRSWNNLKTAVINAANAIKTQVSNAWNNLKTAVINAANTLKTQASNAWNTLKTAVINAATALKTSAENAWTTLKTNVINAANTIMTNASSAWNNLKKAVIDAANSLKENAIKAWSDLKTNVSTFAGNIETAVTTAWTNISTAASTAWSAVSGAVSDAIEAAKKVVDDFLEKIKGLATFEWKLPDPKLPDFSSILETVRGWIAKIKEEMGGLVGAEGPITINKNPWGTPAYNSVITQSSYGTTSDSAANGFVAAQPQAGTAVTINVYATPGMDVNQLADQIQARFVALQKQRDLAYA